MNNKEENDINVVKICRKRSFEEFKNEKYDNFGVLYAENKGNNAIKVL